VSENTQAYVGVGCNLGDRRASIASAVAALTEHDSCQSVICSSLYETSPMGPQDQPDYLNAVIGLQTSLVALDLLHLLQSIENNHGRTRDGERWGARTLDLDLLVFGKQIIETQELTVPHKGIADRSFVLKPLEEIAPELVIPGKGPVKQLVEECRQFNIRRLDS